MTAAIIMQNGAAALGYETLAVLAIVVYVVQGFVGYPLTAIFLKREARRLMASFPENREKWLAAKGSAANREDVQRKRLIPPVPEQYRSIYLSLFKVFATVFISIQLEKLTAGAVSRYVFCLLLGVIFAEIGILEKKCLDETQVAGSIAFNMTAAMSALDCFTITLIGKGGHGSMPHKSIDAITLSAQVINNIQYIVSRQCNPLEPLVITIGTISGGFMWNIIADSVKMTGTMRSYNNQVREKALRELEQCIRASCDCVGAAYTFENSPAVNPLVNHMSTSRLLEEIATDLLGSEKVKIMEQPHTASEDFSNYLYQVPGTFMWLGCCSGESTGYPLHHPCFNMDESALKNGVAIHLAIADRFLNTEVEL